MSTRLSKPNLQIFYKIKRISKPKKLIIFFYVDSVDDEDESKDDDEDRCTSPISLANMVMSSYITSLRWNGYMRPDVSPRYLTKILVLLPASGYTFRNVTAIMSPTCIPTTKASIISLMVKYRDDVQS